MKLSLYQVIIYFGLLMNAATCQSQDNIINDAPIRLRTWIDGTAYTASGFQYLDSVHGLLIVSNRHVLYRNERVPDSITVFSRFNPDIVSYSYTADFLSKNTFVHDSMDYDVALIKNDWTKVTSAKPIEVSIMPEQESSVEANPVTHLFVVQEGHIDVRELVELDYGDKVLIAGYPKGFYDRTNNTAVVQTASIATQLGSNYEGKPCFLVDKSLIGGSSGSLTLAEIPKPFVNDKGEVKWVQNYKYVFLGVYSSHFNKVDKRDGTRIGFSRIWYPSVIQDIIQKM